MALKSQPTQGDHNLSRTSLTFALMDPPFESERATSAMRLIEITCRRGYDVKVFDYEGSVLLPFTLQQTHANAVHGRDADQKNHPLTRVWIAELMALASAHGGTLDWVNCGLCVDERGAKESIAGVRRGSPADLVAFSAASAGTLVIGTR